MFEVVGTVAIVAAVVAIVVVVVAVMLVVVVLVVVVVVVVEFAVIVVDASASEPRNSLGRTFLGSCVDPMTIGWDMNRFRPSPHTNYQTTVIAAK